MRINIIDTQSTDSNLKWFDHKLELVYHQSEAGWPDKDGLPGSDPRYSIDYQFNHDNCEYIGDHCISLFYPRDELEGLLLYWRHEPIEGVFDPGRYFMHHANNLERYIYNRSFLDQDYWRDLDVQGFRF